MSEDVTRKFFWKAVPEPKENSWDSNEWLVKDTDLVLKIESGCFAQSARHHTPIELCNLNYLDIPTDEKRFFIFRKFERVYFSQFRKVESLEKYGEIPWYFSYEIELDYGKTKPRFKAYSHIHLLMCFALILKKNGYRDLNLESFCEKVDLDYWEKPNSLDDYCVWKRFKKIYPVFADY